MNRFIIIFLISVIGNGFSADVYLRTYRLDSDQVAELTWDSLLRIHDSFSYKDPTGKF